MNFSSHVRNSKIGLLAALFFLALFQAEALAEPESQEPKIHTVKKGETIFSIAKLYGISTELLMEANGLLDAKKLKLGQKLVINQTYKVQKGDTLFGIARKFDISVEELRKLNKLTESSVLKAGDSLLLASPRGSVEKAAQKPEPLIAAQTQKPDPQPEKSAAEGQAQADKADPKADGAVKTETEPPVPPKTAARLVDAKLEWPAKGSMSYLEGKLFGILIQAQKGDPVKAVASGTVISAGPYRGFGQVVFVQGENGYVFVYGGNESVKVRGGEEVRKGAELGSVGLDAKDGKPNAYFIVFRNGDPVDPALAPRS